MSNDLVQQAREALDGAGGGPAAKLVRDLADEVERLRAWKAEALPVLEGLQELGRALGVGLGHSITGSEAAELVRELTAERDEERARVERLRDERDSAAGEAIRQNGRANRALAAVARVRALAGNLDGQALRAPQFPCVIPVESASAAILAALAGGE